MQTRQATVWSTLLAAVPLLTMPLRATRVYESSWSLSFSTILARNFVEFLGIGALVGGPGGGERQVPVGVVVKG